MYSNTLLDDGTGFYGLSNSRSDSVNVEATACVPGLEWTGLLYTNGSLCQNILVCNCQDAKLLPKSEQPHILIGVFGGLGVVFSVRDPVFWRVRVPIRFFTMRWVFLTNISMTPGVRMQNVIGRIGYPSIWSWISANGPLRFKFTNDPLKSVRSMTKNKFFWTESFKSALNTPNSVSLGKFICFLVPKCPRTPSNSQ